jgi:hypothetical protein
MMARCGETIVPAYLSLPPEIWYMVFENLRSRKSQFELEYLWGTVHTVSLLFEDAIEKMYCEEHMSKMWLHFGHGKWHLSHCLS